MSFGKDESDMSLTNFININDTKLHINVQVGTSIMQNLKYIYIFQLLLFVFDVIIKHLPWSFDQMLIFTHDILN